MPTAKVNLHAHESQHSFDSNTPVEEMAAEYRAQGFDAVGFVGHGDMTTVDAPGLITINGVEHGTGPGVHLVAYPQHDFYIAAHPRYGILPRRAVRQFVDLYQPDAVEKYNSGMGQYSGEVGTSYMQVETKRMTEDAIMDAIKRGNYTIHSEGVSVSGYVRKAIDVVLPGD